MGNIAEDYGQKENYTQKWEIYGTMDKRQAGGYGHHTSGQKAALYGDCHSADYRNMGKAYYMHVTECYGKYNKTTEGRHRKYEDGQKAEGYSAGWRI